MAIPFTKVRTKLGLDDTFGFGRHKGYTVLEIIKDRPEYIHWLIANTDLKFYESVTQELSKYVPKVNKVKHYRPWDMPDYDHDTLSDWCDPWDDVPF